LHPIMRRMIGACPGAGPVRIMKKSASMSCIVLPTASVASRPKSHAGTSHNGAAPRLAASRAKSGTAGFARTANRAAGACRVVSRVIALAALAAMTPTPAAAQAGPNLGGGFIQFLFSGIVGGGGTARPAPAPANAAVAVQGEWRGAVDPRYDRQIVAYDGEERPGTVIIDTPQRLLYLVEPGGKAMRYGIGVGRPGFTWAGIKTV
jgi:lipoprotein-anchoring transpeptidase ErfK/SrfK